MFRLAVLLSTLSLGATAVAASTYSANPAVPASGRFITRDIVWTCGPAACQGATEESRPVVLCESLAKRAGRVDTFLVDGRALTAPDLDKCNASAKGSAAQAVAAK